MGISVITKVCSNVSMWGKFVQCSTAEILLVTVFTLVSKYTFWSISRLGKWFATSPTWKSWITSSCMRDNAALKSFTSLDGIYRLFKGKYGYFTKGTFIPVF